MKKKSFPFTQLSISNNLGRSIKSPIRISDLKDMYIDKALFESGFASIFEEFPESAQFEIAGKGGKYYLKVEDDEKTDSATSNFLQQDSQERIENHLFITILFHFYKFLQKDNPQNLVSITVHFIRKRITGNETCENTFENNNDFTGSELIVNRVNIKGGESQILERMEDGSTEVVFQQKLNAGEFVFIKNETEDLVDDRKLWHQTTPFTVADKAKGDGQLDVLRFEFNG